MVWHSSYMIVVNLGYDSLCTANDHNPDSLHGLVLQLDDLGCRFRTRLADDGDLLGESVLKS